MLSRLSLLTTVFVAAVQASNVIDLIPTNFDSIVGTGKPALVEFFAPWCGHCKNLAPTYEELADVYSHAKDKVVIAKVDADGEGRPLGQKYGVTGFPTLKWFGPDGGEPIPYDGGRDLESLSAFITEKTGLKSKVKPPPPSATKLLDAHTFDDVVMNNTKNVLVAFTAPWCGHCKRMKPVFEEVAQTFSQESECVLANVDADAKPNLPLAQRYGISSFPTIIFFSKDNKEGEHYEGGREEADFVNFLNEKCGTKRAVGGGLNELAGRIPDLDELASKFYTAAGDARASLMEEAKSLASNAGETSQHYLKVMKKVVDGSEEYLKKETARLASILQKKTLSPAKLDEIKVKANILAAFAERKAEELKESGDLDAYDEVESVEKMAKELRDEL